MLTAQTCTILHTIRPFDGWPAWSPNGKWIAFASNRESAYQIYIMDENGQNLKLVANTEGRANAPRWSRDSKTITSRTADTPITVLTAKYSSRILAMLVVKWLFGK